MRLVLPTLLATGLTNAGAIFIAPADSATDGTGFASVSALVHYPGGPQAAISDVAQTSFSVRLTFLGSSLTGPGSGKFQACFSYETIDYYDLSVVSFASGSLAGTGTAGDCTLALPYTLGASQVVQVDLYAKATGDWLTRDPSRAFDVYANATLSSIRGYDYLTGNPYALTVRWEPLVTQELVAPADLTAVPEPATWFNGVLALIVALLPAKQLHRQRKADQQPGTQHT